MTTLREAIESLQRQVAERISDDALSHCWLSLERAQAVLAALAEPPAYTNREVMQKALEALELAKLNGKAGMYPAEIEEIAAAIAAITALRAALAEPQEMRVPMIGACQACGHEHEFPQREPQEPGAPFLCRMGEQEFLLHYIDGRYSFCTDEKGFVHHPVPQRQPLTADETMHLMNETAGHYWADEAHIQRFRAAVEKRHGIGGQE